MESPSLPSIPTHIEDEDVEMDYKTEVEKIAAGTGEEISWTTECRDDWSIIIIDLGPDIDPEPDTGMKREDSYRSNTVSQNGGKLKESKGVNKTIKGFHMKTTWMNSTNLNIVNMEWIVYQGNVIVGKRNRTSFKPKGCTTSTLLVN